MPRLAVYFSRGFAGDRVDIRVDGLKGPKSARFDRMWSSERGELGERVEFEVAQGPCTVQVAVNSSRPTETEFEVHDDTRLDLYYEGGLLCLESRPVGSMTSFDFLNGWARDCRL